MKLSQLLSGAILILTPVLALPSSKSPRAINILTRRQSCVESCSGTCYWQSDIDAALNKGFSLLQDGQTEGLDKYPHQYKDDEGFDFPVSAPWYEFPILSSYKVYSGGSPGPDRVIFNEVGAYAGVITHTGASGDDFVACSPAP